MDKNSYTVKDAPGDWSKANDPSSLRYDITPLRGKVSAAARLTGMLLYTIKIAQADWGKTR